MRIARNVLFAAVAAGCASGGSAPPAPVGPPDAGIEAAALSSTGLDRPLQLVFDWKLAEREARFTGKGVARIEGDRARLDLFGPRGESYLSAVLIGRRLQLPAGLEFVPLPPPDLFWSVLGIFRPPAGGDLVATREDGTTRRLDYRRGDDYWTFRLEGDRLTDAEWVGAEDGRRTVELEGRDARGVPEKATYRDWPAFVELNLELREVHEVDGFPNDIWSISGS
jgi:hypothetical protein